MFKVIAFTHFVCMCLLQVATDCMLVGTIIQEHGLREYHVGFAALVVCSAVLVRLSWREWREECNK